MTTKSSARPSDGEPEKKITAMAQGDWWLWPIVLWEKVAFMAAAQTQWWTALPRRHKPPTSNNRTLRDRLLQSADLFSYLLWDMTPIWLNTSSGDLYSRIISRFVFWWQNSISSAWGYLKPEEGVRFVTVEEIWWNDYYVNYYPEPLAII